MVQPLYLRFTGQSACAGVPTHGAAPRRAGGPIPPYPPGRVGSSGARGRARTARRGRAGERRHPANDRAAVLRRRKSRRNNAAPTNDRRPHDVGTRPNGAAQGVLRDVNPPRRCAYPVLCGVSAPIFAISAPHLFLSTHLPHKKGAESAETRAACRTARGRLSADSCRPRTRRRRGAERNRARRAKTPRHALRRIRAESRSFGRRGAFLGHSGGGWRGAGRLGARFQAVRERDGGARDPAAFVRVGPWRPWRVSGGCLACLLSSSAVNRRMRDWRGRGGLRTASCRRVLRPSRGSCVFHIHFHIAPPLKGGLVRSEKVKSNFHPTFARKSM